MSGVQENGSESQMQIDEGLYSRQLYVNVERFRFRFVANICVFLEPLYDMRARLICMTARHAISNELVLPFSDLSNFGEGIANCIGISC